MAATPERSQLYHNDIEFTLRHSDLVRMLTEAIMNSVDHLEGTFLVVTF